MSLHAQDVMQDLLFHFERMLHNRRNLLEMGDKEIPAERCAFTADLLRTIIIDNAKAFEEQEVTESYLRNILEIESKITEPRNLNG